MSVNPETPESQSRRPGVGKIVAAFTATAVVGGVLAAGVAMPAVGAVGAVTNTAVASFESLPDDLAEPVLKQRVTFLDSSGAAFASYWDENRVVVPLDAMAPYVREAIIAVEDERFYEHNGVDVRGTLRALATNSGSGEVQQGGSTITQQYVKMILLNNARTEEEQRAAVERTPERKLREASYAISLEKSKTKEEILQGYLNIAYFGAGAYGVEAAAERYFGANAAWLTLPQAATLAGVVQQPGAFDPIRNPEASQARRDVVLTKMVEQGRITEAEYQEAINTPLVNTLNPVLTPNGCPETVAPYFCDYTLKTILVNPLFGATPEARQELLNKGGFFVNTTLDSRTQAAAQEATFDAIPATDPSGKATAISMVQPSSGRILAMAQNRYWAPDGVGNTTYNYNVDVAHGGTIGMQAGSTFKVFTLMAALERGISPRSQIEGPQVKTFTGFRNCEGFRFPPYTVENSTGSGTYDMYSGTANSVNTYFVGLAERVPLCRQAEIAESMGVTRGSGEKLAQVPSFPLGSNEVTPLSMAGAYATIANHGRYCEPHSIDALVAFNGRAAGNPIIIWPSNCPQVVSEQVADTTADILVNVVNAGTGRSVAFGRPAAGKTGTTDSNAAVWFAGFTPQVAAAVWVGDPRGGFRYPLRNLTINGRFVQAGFGSTLAGPVWKASMIAAHEDIPPTGFTLNRGASGRLSSSSAAAPQPSPTPTPVQSPQPAPAEPQPDQTGTDYGLEDFKRLTDDDD